MSTDWHPDSQTASVFACISINSLIGAGFLVLFEIWRIYNVEIYAPRLRSAKDSTIAEPKKTILGWLWQVLEVNDKDLLYMIGMDGYVLLRFLRMCGKICMTCSVFLIFLLPVYFTAQGSDDVVGISKYSMANVVPHGNRLWICLLATYLFCLIFLYYMYYEYEHFAITRRKFFEHGDINISQQKNYSIQVENIPVKYRSSAGLYEFFDNLFPGEVLYCNIAVSLQALDTLIAERDAAVAQLENVIAAYESDPKRRRPQLKLRKGVPVMCGGDSTVDAITFYSDQIAILNGEVSVLQAEGHATEGEPMKPPDAKAERRKSDNTYGSLNSPTNRDSSSIGGGGSSGNLDLLNKNLDKLNRERKKVEQKLNVFASDLSGKLLDAKDKLLAVAKFNAAATGFVTFKTRRSQVVACQIPILSAKYPKVTARAAPEPKDIIWSNIETLPEYTQNMAYLTSAFFNSGLLFWGGVMAFIAAVSNIENLAEYLPFLNNLDPATYALLQGQLPVVIMIIFISLIPVVMTYIVQVIEKRKTNSDVQMEVFQWFYAYQLANVYLVLLAGSIFDSLSDAISDPASIVALIGTALPSVSVFFINYMLTALLSGVPAVLLRLNNVIIFRIYRIIFREPQLTRRQLVTGPLADCSVDYGTTLPDFLYCLCITQLYWVISPLLLIVSTLYFVCMYIAWKYQYLYVIVRTYESGGVYFYGLYKYSMIGLISGAVTMTSFLGLKQGVIQTPLMVPLFAIIIYVWRLTEARFLALSMNLPYSSAVNADLGRSDEHLEINAESHDRIIATFTENFNKQPNLTHTEKAYPYPYRINNIPLLDKNGLLNEVYHDDEPRGVDPAQELAKYLNEEQKSVAMNVMHV